MHTKIIEGKKIRDRILLEVAELVAELPFVPKFCDVLVGGDPASVQYVKLKNAMARKLGIEAVDAVFPESATTEEVVARIQELNAMEHMCGLIVQLPLPATIDKQAVLSAIDPEIDIDCIGPKNSALFYEGKPGVSFPTALAVMEIIDSLPFEISKRAVAIVGNGELVGKPVRELLRRRGVEAQGIDTKTEFPEDILREADVIISAAGKPNLVNGNIIKEGAIVIDAATSESGGGIVGDVEAETVIGKASVLAPVPGGVGPVTVAMLFRNLFEVAESRARSQDAIY